MLNPFIDLLSNIIHLYSLCVIAWAVLATLISFNIINGYQPFVRKVMQFLSRVCEPVLGRIRRFIPDLGGIDISPVILLLLLQFLQEALYTYFYRF